MELEWTRKITRSGWYAWKYTTNITNDFNGIEWFDVTANGTESSVSFYLMGNGKRQSCQEELPISVAPITITPYAR